MALSSYAIITVDEAATMLADFGGIEGTRKTFYEDLINSASEEVEAYLNSFPIVEFHAISKSFCIFLGSSFTAGLKNGRVRGVGEIY